MSVLFDDNRLKLAYNRERRGVRDFWTTHASILLAFPGQGHTLWNWPSSLVMQIWQPMQQRTTANANALKTNNGIAH